MISQELIEKARSLHSAGSKEVYLVLASGDKRKHRLGKTADGEIMYMAPGKRSRGYYLSRYYTDAENPVVDIIAIVTTLADIEAKWRKSIDKAIKLLEASKLWPENLENLKLAKEIGYHKLRAADTAYWAKHVEDYEANRIEVLKRIKEIDARLIKIDPEDGREFVDTNIVWYMDNPLKIKKMNFGKYVTELKLQEIKEALVKKQKIHVDGDNGYDVSFEYDGNDKAWYSEEYRGCGNGHYYLALSDSYALFYEDD